MEGYEIYNFTLFEAFPTIIAPQGLNWGSEDMHRLSVSFAYVKWESSATIIDFPAAPTGGPSTGVPSTSIPNQTVDLSGSINSEVAGYQAPTLQ